MLASIWRTCVNNLKLGGEIAYEKLAVVPAKTNETVITIEVIEVGG